MIIDVHCHLHFPQFDNILNEVIERSKNSGVTAIITSATQSSDYQKVLEMSSKHRIVKASLGIYPSYAASVSQQQLDQDLAHIKENSEKIWAVGEIGLDYKEISDTKSDEPAESLIKRQKEAFLAAIALAKKINKPIVIHSRKAEKDIIEILESSSFPKDKVILHCFTGNLKLVKRAEDAGFNFSIPTNITRLQHFQYMAEQVSINQLLTETDAPYLSPYPGKINEPSFIKETIKVIAKIKNMNEEEVENNIFMNCQRIFPKISE